MQPVLYSVLNHLTLPKIYERLRLKYLVEMVSEKKFKIREEVNKFYSLGGVKYYNQVHLSACITQRHFWIIIYFLTRWGTLGLVLLKVDQ